MEINSSRVADTLPCRHTAFPPDQVEVAKGILRNLAESSPHLLDEADIDPELWAPLLRAAVESLRGANAATPTDKKRFIEAIFLYCKLTGVIANWSFIGTTSRRQDYRIELPDGTLVAVEAKGCGDGNNTNIWTRPTWANEFVVWSLCPESLQHPPGKGVWSGISTRLAVKMTAELAQVDAYLFWDARCGTDDRRCPKQYGVTGGLRELATDFEGQFGQTDWVPPPCIYLFPRSAPTVPHNMSPPPHTVATSKFSDALLTAFNVPDEEKSAYVHQVRINAKGTTEGTEILVSAISRCWPDGNERNVTTGWKPVREA